MMNIEQLDRGCLCESALRQRWGEPGGMMQCFGSTRSLALPDPSFVSCDLSRRVMNNVTDNLVQLCASRVFFLGLSGPSKRYGYNADAL